MGKELQFELWQECNSRCTYCSLGKENMFTPDEFKLQSLELAYNELSNSNVIYDVIGFIGGEFFQGQLNTPQIYNKFMDLMKLVNKKLNNNSIKELWLNATMTIGDQKDLWDTLDLFDDYSKIWILTSYDTLGRFHTPKMLETWENSLNKLHTKYPTIKLNTTSIITGNFIDMYLKDEFNINEFKEKYNTSLFLKTPVKPDHLSHLSKVELNKILGDFFPTQSKFKQFLLKYKLKEGKEEYDNLFSNDLKATEIRKNFNNNDLRNVTFIRDKKTYKETLDCDSSLKYINTLDCGHSGIYQSYVDTDGCSICDKILIGNL